jgi:hypothetical protein
MIHDGYDRHQITAALNITPEQAMAALTAYARSVLLPDEGYGYSRPADPDTGPVPDGVEGHPATGREVPWA